MDLTIICALVVPFVKLCFTRKNEAETKTEEDGSRGAASISIHLV